MDWGTGEERKRINISIDGETYDKLQRVRRKYGFKNLCEMFVAFARILAGRMNRKDDPPEEEDDGEYIARMFDELGNAGRTPDGTVPVRRRNRTNGKGQGL